MSDKEHIYTFSAIIEGMVYPQQGRHKLHEDPTRQMYLWLFNTTELLPHSKEKTTILDPTPIYTNILKTFGTKLQIGVEYQVRAVLTHYQTRGEIYYSYKPLNCVSSINNERDRLAFLAGLCTLKRAHKILATYPDFIERVVKHHETEFHVKTIKPATMELIIKEVKENYFENELQIWLSQFRVTIKTIKKLLQINNDPVKLRHMIEQNPYILTRARGIGFHSADEIAMKINPELRTSQFRLEAYITQLFYDIANGAGDNKELKKLYGYTIIPEEKLLKLIHKTVPECEHHYFNLKITDVKC